MRTQRLLAAAALVLLLPAVAPAATLTIVNIDGAGEGFNDPTFATPVGGNAGTTIGQQRLIAFQYAADLWGALLPSDVTIVIRAAFNPLTCDASSGVLGSAGPVQVFSDFANAPVANTWYHAALANRLAGVDLAPGAPGTNADDLSAQFNSSIDNNNNCLSGTNWYYGLDGNHGGDIDLVTVLLHEFGHGLGFSTLASGSTGQWLSGRPDAFGRFIRDNTLGLNWDQMSNTQRQASAINTGNLAFSGPAATNAAPAFLGGVPTLFVNAPVPPLAPSYAIGTASFGPAVPQGGVTGELVLANDGSAPTSDACQPLVNGASVAGRIALIDRGTCTFALKAEAAQAAGAVAVIIANNVAGVAPPTLGGASATLTIPTVSVSLETGNALKAQLGAGVVNVTIGYDPGQLAGADATGRPLLYAPNPLQPGSSVSHFDISATPNLLMEPAINADLGQDVDLTLAVFRDLGWISTSATAVDGPPAPALLAQNFPNPFNPSTTIAFALAQDGPARLAVYDLSGRLVRTLVDGPLARGAHTATWDGRDDAGRGVASGIYVYRLRAGGRDEARRMALLK